MQGNCIASHAPQVGAGSAFVYRVFFLQFKEILKARAVSFVKRQRPHVSTSSLDYYHMKKRSFLLVLPFLALSTLFSPPAKAEPGSLKILKFEADWCGPCQKMKPIFSTVSKEFGASVAFESIDVDKQPRLAETYKVELLPTVIAVKDGKVVGRSTGFMNAAKLKGFIKKHR